MVNLYQSYFKTTFLKQNSSDFHVNWLLTEEHPPFETKFGLFWRQALIKGLTFLYHCAALEQQVSEVDQRLKTKQDELRVLNSYKVSQKCSGPTPIERQ